MTEEELGKNIDKNSLSQENQIQVQELQEQLQVMQRELMIQKDKENLKEENYFRQQLLMLEERKAIAAEDQVKALKSLSETPLEKEIGEQ